MFQSSLADNGQELSNAHISKQYIAINIAKKKKKKKKKKYTCLFILLTFTLRVLDLDAYKKQTNSIKVNVKLTIKPL